MVALKNPKFGYSAGDLLQDPAFVPLRGVELALMRAKPALEAGWQLTPEEAMSMTGIRPPFPGASARLNAGACGELEDEIDELALYFGDC